MFAPLNIAAAGASAAADNFSQRATNVAAVSAGSASGAGGQATPAQGANTQDAPPPTSSGQASQDRDFTKEFSGMIGDKAAFKANVAVMRTADDMTGVLLDIVA